MIELSIVIKDGAIQKVYNDSKEEIKIELLNFDAVYSLDEKRKHEARIRDLDAGTP